MNPVYQLISRNHAHGTVDSNLLTMWLKVLFTVAKVSKNNSTFEVSSISKIGRKDKLENLIELLESHSKYLPMWLKKEQAGMFKWMDQRHKHYADAA